MGEVYRAKDARLGRNVAIKFLPRAFVTDLDRLRRFEQEARAAGMLNHPNILAIFDTGSHDGAPYVVSELLEGETLGERLVAGPLPLRKAEDYAIQLANGLTAAHDKGIVHRDLKPDNLFLTKEGRLKILDFGLAKLVEEGDAALSQTVAPTVAARTEPGVMLGTVGYMSPEQAYGLPADHRADIFSFGVIFFEMLTGQQPFRRGSPLDTLHAITKEDISDITQVKPEIPRYVGQIIGRCVAKDPGDRFQSARDLAFSLEALGAAALPAATQNTSAPISVLERRSPIEGKWIAVAAAAVLVLAIAGIVAARRSLNTTSQPELQRLTFRQGTVWSARFAQEGRTVVYSAAWERKPVEMFSTNPGSAESRPLGFSGADILALSTTKEMASLMKDGSNLDWGWRWGTLARVPFAGGAPREVLKEVQLADWTNDGSGLVIVRMVDGRTRVESKDGKVLYETLNRIGALKVSPAGDLVGFAERPSGLGGTWSIGTVDANGTRRILSSGWPGEFADLVWSGNELWFDTQQVGDGLLHAVTLSGRHRVLARLAAPLRLFDVARDGRALVGRAHWRSGVMGLPPYESRERDLSWLDASELDDISSDGGQLLITEFGEGGGIDRWSVYVRKTDDSPAVRLGDGQAFTFSPDGSRALALRRTSPPQLTLWPTGAGEPITLRNENITDYYWGDWLPDGKRIVFSGAEQGRPARCYIQNIESGQTKAITPEGTTFRVGQQAVSPAGDSVVATDLKGKVSLYPISGGEPRAIPGLEPGDVPIRWSIDERSLFVLRKTDSVPKVYSVDLATGRNALWKEIMPADPTGIIGIWGVQIAPDDKSYYYSYMRNLNDLYIVTGLK